MSELFSSSMRYIPVATTEGGLSLTFANWAQVNACMLSFYLEHLLIKPGNEVLKHMASLKSYLKWQGIIVLNASTLKLNSEGVSLVSPLDGSKIKRSCDELIQLIHHLCPDAVLLPPHITSFVPDLWNQWPEIMMPFVSKQEGGVVPRNCGVYEKQSHDIKIFSSPDMNASCLIESDYPANLALQGLAIQEKGCVDIASVACAQVFKVIDQACACPTCSEQFTQAYLHHLFHATPLLAKRLLILHNLYAFTKLRRLGNVSEVF